MITPGHALASALAGSLLGLVGAWLALRLSAGAGRTPPLPLAAAIGAMLAPPAVFWLPQGSWPAAALLLLLLLAIGWLDLLAGVVHAALALPLAVAGLGFALLAAPEAITAALAGAALGYLLFRLVEVGFRWLRTTEGIGRGDAWVLGAAGAWVGPGGIGKLVLLASLAGLLTLLLRHGGRLPEAQAAIPFAPALALAAWLVWLDGGGVAAWTP